MEMTNVFEVVDSYLNKMSKMWKITIEGYSFKLDNIHKVIQNAFNANVKEESVYIPIEFNGELRSFIVIEKENFNHLYVFIQSDAPHEYKNCKKVNFKIYKNKIIGWFMEVKIMTDFFNEIKDITKNTIIAFTDGNLYYIDTNLDDVLLD